MNKHLIESGIFFISGIIIALFSSWFIDSIEGYVATKTVLKNISVLLFVLF